VIWKNDEALRCIPDHNHTTPTSVDCRQLMFSPPYDCWRSQEGGEPK